MSYRRRFNLDEVLREWAAEQVATSRDPRRSGEETASTTDGGAEEDEVRRRDASQHPWTDETIFSGLKVAFFCHK